MPSVSRPSARKRATRAPSRPGSRRRSPPRRRCRRERPETRFPRAQFRATPDHDHRAVLNAAKDATLLAKFNVKPFQVTALKDMHQKLAAVLGNKDQIHAVAAADLLKVDKLQLWLETWFGDVGAAADWALDDEKRLQLVSLLPRTDMGRGKGKVAPVVAGNEGSGEAAS